LRAADLSTVNGDGGIIGHILRLERCRAIAAFDQRAANPGHQNGFADIRSGTLYHNRFGHMALLEVSGCSAQVNTGLAVEDTRSLICDLRQSHH
jgi:hypothetical protein